MDSPSRELLPRLPRRLPDAHKGDFGTAVIVGGSWGMAGAAALAGMAALRSGAGKVHLAVARSCLNTVAGFEPSYMTAPLAEDAAGRIAAAAYPQIVELAKKATVIACGPGLGRSDELDELVARMYCELSSPMLFDADALNALASRSEVLDRPGGPRILTPHPGEFARLVGKKVANEDGHRVARELAGRCGVVVVLKGHHTLVTDGTRAASNLTGNPGMATGGSGDSLTGIITALACQGLDPFDAARLGVHLHGLAGDLAARKLGQASLIASDIIRFLPAAFLRYQAHGG